MPTNVEDLQIGAAGARRAVWRYRSTSTAMHKDGGRPCVVMAHGFGGVREGLTSYASALAGMGADVLLFDYLGFGASEGASRQDISVPRQQADYRAVIEAARTLDEVDPAKIVLWGVSYSGGHVIALAARDPSLAAVIALTPTIDGRAAVVQSARVAGAFSLVRGTGHAMWDLASTLTGRSHRVPLIGEPGTLAVMTTPGALDVARRMGGPAWTNEVTARSILGISLFRATTDAPRVKQPVLVQIGSRDSVAPPEAARAMVGRLAGPVSVHEYDADHFDVYDGDLERAVFADEERFLLSLFAR